MADRCIPDSSNNFCLDLVPPALEAQTNQVIQDATSFLPFLLGLLALSVFLRRL